MQKKIHVHKGKESRDKDVRCMPGIQQEEDAPFVVCPRGKARIIGATSMMTQVQITRAANIMALYNRVDYDGDQINGRDKQGLPVMSFANAIGDWVEMKSKESLPAPGSLDYPMAVPHCKPDAPMNYRLVDGTNAFTCYEDDDQHIVSAESIIRPTECMTSAEWRVEHPGGEDNPTKVAEGLGDEMGHAKDFIAETLGAGAVDGVSEYFPLAVADYIAEKPNTVFWLIEEDREAQGKPLDTWVSLAEYKALNQYCGRMCEGTNWIIINKQGNVITLEESLPELYKLRPSDLYGDTPPNFVALAGLKDSVVPLAAVVPLP